MLNKTARFQAFASLGHELTKLKNSEELGEWGYRSQSFNSWFTPENVAHAVGAIASGMLDPDRLKAWLDRYPEASSPAKIGVIMAGNIPAAGFHDALCVLISGHTLLAKLSSGDAFLTRKILETLTGIEPRFKPQIHFVERVNEADAYIATGSNNSARYFEYYFAKKPHIIRKNRVSVALLTGKETDEELKGLGEDMLRYYGLGCRNVAKLLVPEGYDFDRLYTNLSGFSSYCLHHHKYFNNYEYNKSIALINGVPHYDNGFLLLEANPAIVSPLSVVYYQTYRELPEALDYIRSHRDQIQCITGPAMPGGPTVPFGQAQHPAVDDYADGVDTMAFLGNL